MTETEICSRPFSLSKADYLAYYRATYFRRFTTLPWCLVNWLFLIGVSACLAFVEIVQHHYQAAALIAVAFLAIWVLVLPALGVSTLLRNLSKTPNAYLPRTAAIAVPNLTIEGQGFTHRQAWSGFRQVHLTKRLIVLTMTTGQAMIVLKSAFATPAECDAFVASCRHHIGGSRHPQARVFDAPMVAAPLADSLDTPPFRLGFGLFFMLSVLAMARALTRPTTLLGVAAGMIAFPAWMLRDRLAKDGLAALWPQIIGTTAFAVLFPPLMALVNWFFVRNKPTMRQPRRLAINRDQLRLYMEGSDVAINWSTIRRIDRRFGGLQFWVNWASSIAVPLSAFASPDDAQAFQDQATAWWKAARKSSSPGAQ